MKNQKGFTLIELSIVLVIIGIILGAVLKGPDLIASARAKKLVTTVNTWSISCFTFMDRMGRFPGDETTDGYIGDQAGTEGTVATGAIQELENNGFSNLPSNPVSLGGSSYWIYLGSSTINGVMKNVMVICNNATCTGNFTTDDVKIIQAVDNAIDGSADAGLGQFRGVLLAGAPTLIGAGTTTGGRATAVVTAITPVSVTTGGTATPWGATDVAAVWLFDKSF